MIAPPPFPSPKFPTNDVANSRPLCDGKRERPAPFPQHYFPCFANTSLWPWLTQEPTRLLPLPKQRPSFFTLPAERRASERRLPRRRERLNGERDGRRRRRWQAGTLGERRECWLLWLPILVREGSIIRSIRRIILPYYTAVASKCNGNRK